MLTASFWTPQRIFTNLPLTYKPWQVYGQFSDIISHANGGMCSQVFISSCVVSGQLSRHSFTHGYRNGISWGTGPQIISKSFNQRKDKENYIWVILQIQGGNVLVFLLLDVCGTDGSTYSSECKLKQSRCSMVRDKVCNL